MQRMKITGMKTVGVADYTEVTQCKNSQGGVHVDVIMAKAR